MNSNEYVKLPRSFYVRSDVVQIAKELIGKFVFTNIDGNLTGGKIVETEAYNGRNDLACHAIKGKTKRNVVMYENGGVAYVYLCYGIHHLLNVVTNREGLADAVLIRAIEPCVGIEVMRHRRCNPKSGNLTSGPGVLSQALGITYDYTGTDFVTTDSMWICFGKNTGSRDKIETDVRIGIDYAGEDAFLPWRFFIKDNSYVSKQKKSRTL